MQTTFIYKEERPHFVTKPALCEGTWSVGGGGGAGGGEEGAEIPVERPVCLTRSPAAPQGCWEKWGQR